MIQPDRPPERPADDRDGGTAQAVLTGVSSPEKRSALRLIVSHALAATAMSLPWPALLALVWEQTHQAALVGLVGATRLAPYIALSWLVGGIGDRVDRMRLVRVTTLVRTLLLAAAAGAVALHQVWLACGLAAVAVCVGTPAYPTAAAAVPDLFRGNDEHADAARRGTTNWLVTVEVSAFTVGPAVCGLLISTIGPRHAIYPAAVLSGVAWLIVLGVRTIGSTREQTSTGSQLRQVLAVPQAVRALVTMMAVNVVDGALAGGLLLLTVRHWQADQDAFGIVTAALGFGCLAAPLLSLPRLSRLPPPVWLCVQALVVGLLALTPGWSWSLPVLLAIGAVGVQVECAATVVLQNCLPANARAAALGIGDTAMIAAGMVGAALAPTVIEQSSAGLFVTLLIGCLLGAALLCRRDQVA